MRRLLFIDDDPDIRTVAEVALTATEAFDITCASSGPEALELLKTVRPDVILLDMMMPGMDGLETLAALRAADETRSTPIIFLTARVQPDEVVHYRQSGANGVIAKPFDPMTLADEVQRLLEEA